MQAFRLGRLSQNSAQTPDLTSYLPAVEILSPLVM